MRTLEQQASGNWSGHLLIADAKCKHLQILRTLNGMSEHLRLGTGPLVSDEELKQLADEFVPVGRVLSFALFLLLFAADPKRPTWPGKREFRNLLLSMWINSRDPNRRGVHCVLCVRSRPPQGWRPPDYSCEGR